MGLSHSFEILQRVVSASGIDEQGKDESVGRLFREFQHLAGRPHRLQGEDAFLHPGLVHLLHQFVHVDGAKDLVWVALEQLLGGQSLPGVGTTRHVHVDPGIDNLQIRALPS